MRLRPVSSSAVVLLEQTTQNGHLADDSAGDETRKSAGNYFPRVGDGRSEQSPRCICRPPGRIRNRFRAVACSREEELSAIALFAKLNRQQDVYPLGVRLTFWRNQEGSPDSFRCFCFAFFEVRSLESAFYELLPCYPHPVSVRREYTFLCRNEHVFFLSLPNLSWNKELCVYRRTMQQRI